MKFGSRNVNFCVVNIILDISFLEWRLWWLLKIFGWIPCYLILPVEWVRSGSGHHNWLMVLNINAIFIESVHHLDGDHQSVRDQINLFSHVHMFTVEF